MKNFVVIVPARKGSKRLLNKNILELNNLSLIEHTLRFCKNLTFDVIVTTNYDKILNLSDKYKNFIFHKRSDELSGDTISQIDVIKDIIIKYNYHTKNIILLQPTSPIRSLQTLNNMIKLFTLKNDSIVTLEQVENPRFGSFDNITKIYKPINYEPSKRSQDINNIYHENGNTYIIKASTILKNKLFNNNLFGYILNNKDEICDIDTKYDLIYTEQVLKDRIIINDISVSSNRKIGLNQPVFIIAEACDNHMGRMDYAYKMIDCALLCGADAIKFQHHLPDEEMLSNVPMSNNFKEPLYDLLKKYSLTLNQHKQLKKYCDNKGIMYMCTPFSVKAADEIDELISIYKIGSGEATDHPTLIEIAKKGKPMIISTGMTNIDEIEETLDIVRKINKNIIIMNCTSEYPPNYTDINVNLIPKLRDRFNILVGHSDHTPDNYTCFSAVSCGAKIIEKHIILNKIHDGPDQNVSIDPFGLHDLVEGIRKIELALGAKKSIHELEKPIKEWARRSIVSIKNIKKGDKFTVENTWCKRPGTGIPSKYLYSKIINKTAKNDVKVNSLIKYNDIQDK